MSERKSFAEFAQGAYNKKAVASAGILLQHSTNTVAVYESPFYFVIACRGTTDLGDVMTDVEYAANTVLKYFGIDGETPNRFLIDENHVRKVLGIIKGRKPIYIVGHSLGGAVATYIYERHRLEIAKCITYNEVSDRFEDPSGSLRPATHHRIEGDPVSYILDYRKDQTEKKKNPNFNAHTIIQFLMGE